MINNVNYNVSNKTKFFVFEENIINKINDLIFVNYPSLKSTIKFTDNDFYFLNIMIDYLENKESISTDDALEFMEKNQNLRSYETYYYLYFLYLYSKFNFNFLSENFNSNIEYLFFDLELESIFNRDKFSVEQNNELDIDISNDLDNELVSYVTSHIPNNCTDLEKSIAIYILLCEIFTYNISYTIFNDFSKTRNYNEVNMIDNDVVCMQFSVIFYKMLKSFGINASLEGDMESHFYVIYNIGSMVIKADGTRYGYYDEDAEVLGLSDLANVKFGFRIKSLELYRPFYKKDNKKYWNFNNKKLEAIIDSVYNKLAYIQEMDTKFGDFIDFMLNKQLKKKEIRLKREGIFNDFDSIKERIDYFNLLTPALGHKVENLQFVKKYFKYFFLEFIEYGGECVTLYQKKENDILLYPLIILYDDDTVPYYYLSDGSKYVKYTKEELINYMFDSNLYFKHDNDVDALELEESRALKLLRY